MNITEVAIKDFEQESKLLRELGDALKIWHSAQPAMEEMLDGCDTQDKFERYKALNDEVNKNLQMVFWMTTSERCGNSLSACRSCPASHIQSMYDSWCLRHWGMLQV